jgi:integrase
MKIQQIIAAYAEEHQAMGYTSSAWRSFAKEVSAFFGEDKSVREAMTSASVAQYIGHCRAKGNSPQTLTNKLSFLKKLCLLNTEAGNLVAFPRRLAKGIVVDNCRERVLSEKEKAALRKALPHSEDWEVLEFAMSTGLRSQELFGLEVADLDFRLNEINVRAELTRTGKSRKVSMVGWVRDYCVKAARKRRQYVIKLVGYEHYKNRTSAGRNWKQEVLRVAVRRAGIKDWRFHDCRHQATTELLEAGASEMAVTTTMGWQSGTYIRRYGNLRRKTLQEAMMKLEKAKGRAK